MKQEILHIIKNNPRRYSIVIKKTPKLHDWVLKHTLVDDTPKFNEMIYSAIYQKSNICKKNNTKKFKDITAGYGFCNHSSKCQCANDSVSAKVSKAKQNYSIEKKQLINKKREETTLTKYGVTNNAQTSHAIKKHKEFYANDNNIQQILTKMQTTSLKRYNVANPMQDPAIAKKAKIKWLELYGKNSGVLHDEITAKRIATSLENWHCTHPSKNPKVIEKIIKTNLKNRGVSFPLQDKSVALKVSNTHLNKKFVNNKTKLRFENSTFLNRAVCYFGIKSLASQMQLSELVLRKQLKKFNIFIPKSQFEIEMQLFVKQLGISNVQYNTWSILKTHEIDVYFPEYDLAIELNGAYWHSEQRNRGKKYHLQKTIGCNKKGIHLLHILDTEWNNSTTNAIWKSIISHKLNKSNRIYARKCKFKEVPMNEAKEFFDQNHLQGFRGGNLKYGLYHDDTLVQCVILGKSRYNKNAEWELIRMASKQNTAVIGGFSKLIAHLDKSFVTYADKRYASGIGYVNIGCTRLNDTPPGYSYVINGVVKSRINFQKHKLKDKLKIFNSQLTEYENMLINGYDRIWDCGHMTYTYIQKTTPKGGFNKVITG